MTNQAPREISRRVYIPSSTAAAIAAATCSNTCDTLHPAPTHLAADVGLEVAIPVGQAGQLNRGADLPQAQGRAQSDYRQRAKPLHCNYRWGGDDDVDADDVDVFRVPRFHYPFCCLWFVGLWCCVVVVGSHVCLGGEGVCRVGVWEESGAGGNSLVVERCVRCAVCGVRCGNNLRRAVVTFVLFVVDDGVFLCVVVSYGLFGRAKLLKNAEKKNNSTHQIRGLTKRN